MSVLFPMWYGFIRGAPGRRGGVLEDSLDPPLLLLPPQVTLLHGLENIHEPVNSQTDRFHKATMKWQTSTLRASGRQRWELWWERESRTRSKVLGSEHVLCVVMYSPATFRTSPKPFYLSLPSRSSPPLPSFCFFCARWSLFHLWRSSSFRSWGKISPDTGYYQDLPHHKI